MFVGDIYSHVLFLGFGFVGGVLVGRFLRKIVVDDITESEDCMKRRMTLNNIYGIATVVLTLLALTTVFISTQEQRRVTECQAKYNEHFIAVLRERTAATTDERNAQIKLSTTMVGLIDAATRPDYTDAQNLEALRQWRDAQAEYGKTIREADKTRADNQYPLPPNCG